LKTQNKALGAAAIANGTGVVKIVEEEGKNRERDWRTSGMGEGGKNDVEKDTRRSNQKLIRKSKGKSN